jgi:predicted nucleotide-binding protein
MNILENYPKQYWHCQVEVDTGGKKSTNAVFNDLTIEELWKQVIEPWHTQKAFTINGTIIRNHEKVTKIKITQTPHSKQHYADEHNVRMRNSNISDMATDRRLLPLSQGTDYTHEFLFSDSKKSSVVSEDKKAVSNKKIFIVHGRDNLAKTEVARFIEKFELEAIILHEQADAGKTIIEKIEAHTDVGFGIVLYTPCDMGGLANSSEQKPRARQNVVLEHGYLMGKLGRDKVCCLVKDGVETPNDISGVVYTPLDEHGAWQTKIAKELKNAGYSIDMNLL